ncbi:hypothetical protein HJC99_01205 [Candidatus Saccharibacteria bacterium]|nr:hypothetical protein [Candidatus Saccharibacteria bacterium]
MNENSPTKLPSNGDSTEQVASVAEQAEEMPIIDTSQFRETSLDEVAEVLSLTIKEDYVNKVLTLLCMLSAYTKDDQINISFNSQSSSGKTYTTTEVAKLFPTKDKIELSGATPTSLFYGEGKKDKILKAKVIEFERKILILSEQSNSLVQTKLRPLLSHDKWELEYRFTNRNNKGSNHVECVILRGYPATVFCSASMRLDEQDATRAIMLSSEVTDEKIRAGIHLQSERGANAIEFDNQLEANPKRRALIERILAIRQAHVDNIILINPEAIEQRFLKTFPKLKARHQRDIAHIQQLIKAIALLNVWFRRQQDGTIVANQNDVDQAFVLWESLAESQDLNVPPALIDFYKDFVLFIYLNKANDPDISEHIKTDKIGVTRKEVADQHYRKNRSMLNDERLRKEILPQLRGSGLIEERKPDIEGSDKRSPHIFPKWFPEGNDPRDANNIGSGSGALDSLDDEARKFFFGH